MKTKTSNDQVPLCVGREPELARGGDRVPWDRRLSADARAPRTLINLSGGSFVREPLRQPFTLVAEPPPTRFLAPRYTVAQRIIAEPALIDHAFKSQSPDWPSFDPVVMEILLDMR